MFSFDMGNSRNLWVALLYFSLAASPAELFVKIEIPGNRSLWVNHLPRIRNNRLLQYFYGASTSNK